jgi:hypothetical protein
MPSSSTNIAISAAYRARVVSMMQFVSLRHESGENLRVSGLVVT